jgi:plasmid stability protein
MSNLSVRGLDDKALAKLKIMAAREEVSVNSVVVRLIEQGVGQRPLKTVVRRHDDLDALAGRWSKREAQAFAKAIAPFSEIDEQLWK